MGLSGDLFGGARGGSPVSPGRRLVGVWHGCQLRETAWRSAGYDEVYRLQREDRTFDRILDAVVAGSVCWWRQRLVESGGR